MKCENTKACEAKNTRCSTTRGTKEDIPCKSTALGLWSSSSATLCQSSWATGTTHAGELSAKHVLVGQSTRTTWLFPFRTAAVGVTTDSVTAPKNHKARVTTLALRPLWLLAANRFKSYWVEGDLEVDRQNHHVEVVSQGSPAKIVKNQQTPGKILRINSCKYWDIHLAYPQFLRISQVCLYLYEFR